jgi:hypothetical protein
LGKACRNKTLDGLPEELVVELFERVLRLGFLTPKVLAMFEGTGHEEVCRRIQGLNIQQLPHILPITPNKWLGY